MRKWRSLSFTFISTTVRSQPLPLPHPFFSIMGKGWENGAKVWKWGSSTIYFLFHIFIALTEPNNLKVHNTIKYQQRSPIRQKCISLPLLFSPSHAPPQPPSFLLLIFVHISSIFIHYLPIIPFHFVQLRTSTTDFIHLFAIPDLWSFTIVQSLSLPFFSLLD